MKKVLVLFLALSFIGVNTTNADAWYKARKKCRSWKKKFKTDAKVKRIGSLYSHDKDKSCTHAHSHQMWMDFTGTDCGVNQYVIAVEAEAEIGNGVAPRVYKHVHSCLTNKYNAGDKDDSRLPIFSNAPIIADNNYNGDQGNYALNTCNSVVFDEENESIMLEGLELALTVSLMDLPNNYSTCLIQVESIIEDEDDIPDQIYWSSKAFIYNGELILEGELSNYSDNFVQLGEGNYQFNPMDLQIDISQILADYGLTMDDIQIACYVDGGNLGIGAPPEYLPDGLIQNSVYLEQNSLIEKSLNFNFELSPVPAGNMLNISITSKESFNPDCNITDLQGRIVQDIGAVEISEGSYDLKVDISTLPSGIYLVNFNDGNGKSYSRKLIK